MAHIISLKTGSRLCVDGLPIGTYLTATEEAVLIAIMTHRQVANKEYIFDVVYAGREEPEQKIIDVLVCKLRRKLGPHKEAIQTCWGRGFYRNPDYEFSAPERTVHVVVDAKLLDDVVLAADETPAELVHRLLQSEHDRLWSTEAA